MNTGRNKKNFTIIGVAFLNIIMTFIVMLNLKAKLPLNLGAKDVIGMMVSKNNLLIIPAIVVGLSALQVLYRLKTIDKKVTTGKRIEDAIFTLLDGVLIMTNWVYVYLGAKYSENLQIHKLDISVWYFILMGIGLLMTTLFSSFSINRFGSKLGYRNKLTLADEEVWRRTNRFSSFTGVISSLILMFTTVYFILNGFKLIPFIAVIVIDALLIVLCPALFSKKATKEKEERIIE